ncbi:hypothetical protein F383_35541 [Gossypium arboreum]|uniref:Uncharacterized protein n=1 Tax=Gossypium arboreum TaxID=29729 RepID=A0A0B0N7F9_GOSAR|nr:hypothetical protein F383_35541 [Gossypium arboreum]
MGKIKLRKIVRDSYEY